MGASNIPGEYVLPAVLHGFREKYQGIAIALTIADTKVIIEKVTANGSTTSVVKAVECGAGVSIVSERAVEKEAKLGLIKKLTLEGVDMNRDFFIVRRVKKLLSPAATAYLEYLKEFPVGI